MLELNLNQKPPSPEERKDIMLRHIDKGGVPVDYDRLIEYIAHSKVEQYEVGLKLARLMGTGEWYTSKKVFKAFFKNNGLTKGFNLTPTGDISLDDDSISSFISTNAYGNEISTIASLYKEYNYYDSQILQLPFILEHYKPTGLESIDGRRIVLIKPGVELQNTGRFGFNQPAFMNFPRYMKDLVVAPKGWNILSADSSQIEPKLTYEVFMRDPQILKLISIYNDVYYAVLHYVTMDESLIRNMTMEFTPMGITDELKAVRNRLKKYNNGVVYGSTHNSERDPLKDSFIKRVGQHPLRIKWKNEMLTKLDRGDRLFTTLFGTPIDVYNSKSYKSATNDVSRRNALENCIINNPMQGTAGDLMGFSLMATDDLFARKAPNSWISKFVHDEGQYCIHDSDYDAVIEEVSGHTSYHIDGVVTIFNDPIIGRKINKDVPISYSNLMDGFDI